MSSLKLIHPRMALSELQILDLVWRPDHKNDSNQTEVDVTMMKYNKFLVLVGIVGPKAQSANKPTV